MTWFASSIFSSFFRLLYPRACVVCGDVLVDGELFLCSACLSGLPLNEGVDEEADEVFVNDLGIGHLYWLFRYDRVSDFHKLVYAIKYRSNRELGVWAGKMLGERMKDVSGIDCIIPVPLHPEREKERGFNQAFMIGMGIASVLGVRVESGVLSRVVNTPSQTGLERGQRADNVAEAFELRDTACVEECHVLLVDDVVTSGATIRACMMELSKIKGIRLSVACLGKSGSI
ncbi:MAG TPA: ComF family protein [Butyricimonas virosa]|uniref:ComF family protein n=1 Tax=Butyricimonas virosa TaxID=544645 RepID=A0A921H7I6_9BACT|nr:ComF family protein [Butyricimonas virosa]